MGKCKETNKPSVDETQIECFNIYRSNCIVTSEADTYLKIGKGETLTNVIKTISDAIKSIRQKLLFVSERRFITGLLNQQNTDAPTIAGVESTLLTNLTYTFTYTSPGLYKMTFSQGVLNPLTTYATLVSNDTEVFIASCKVISTTEVEIKSLNIHTGTLDDNLLSNVPIMIRL